MLAGRFNPAVKIVAVVTQDRGAHALMISAEMHQEISADPAQKLLGQRLLLTDASTAQLFAEKCLGAWNVNLNQMTIVKGEQAQLRRSLAQGDAPVGVFWTPFTYRAANDDAKAKQLPCEGVNDLDLPTVIVARADLLNEADPIQLADNRKRIAQVVARHLGAWALAKKKPIDAAKRLVRVYKDQENITISENQAKAELAVRQPPDLAAQRIAFKAPVGGVAPIAATLDGIIDFTVRTGTISATERPIGSDLIDASIIETIAADQTLLKLARGD
jgi:ABC-type nitrate/sulfonate/bicarbonate transport system substrate-binding protein